MKKNILILFTIASLAPIAVFAQTPAVSDKSADTNSNDAVQQTKIKVQGYGNKGEWKPVKATTGSKAFKKASKKVYSGYDWKPVDPVKRAKCTNCKIMY